MARIANNWKSAPSDMKKGIFADSKNNNFVAATPWRGPTGLPGIIM
jgi:hypothetical protein